MLDSLRTVSKRTLFRFLQKISETDEGKQIITDSIKGLFNSELCLDFNDYKDAISPYAGLGKSQIKNLSSHRDDIIFITGRFRSGTTLLWNIFRKLEGFTAYYEPFNERRWFDPVIRGNKIDKTHRNVDSYWIEYEGLELLGEYYQEEWIRKDLFMDASFWAPEMKRYIELLVERALGRPVLQFNRIDFRLPWIRNNFPNAKIIHLYRHPRDQWCSFLMDISSFSKNENVCNFSAHDKFYLRLWAKDLCYRFPYLNEKYITHPYQMFYYLWKLSYIFGKKFSHYSLSFEDLINKESQYIRDLLHFIDIEKYHVEDIRSMIVDIPHGRWKNYADDEWFIKHENICESTIKNSLNGNKNVSSLQCYI